MNIKSKSKETVELMYNSISYKITPQGVELPDYIAMFFLSSYPKIIEPVVDKKLKSEQKIEKKTKAKNAEITIEMSGDTGK